MKEFSLNRGGGERYVVALTDQLKKMGHEVHLFVNRFEGDYDEPLIHKVPMIRHPAFLKLLSFPYFCHRQLKRGEFDIIYGLTQIYLQDVHRPGGGLHRFWMERKYKSGFASRLARLTPLNLAMSHIEGKIFKYQGCRRIIANSRMIRDQVIGYYHLPPERVEVVYNGVDLGRFNPSVRERYGNSVRSRYGIRDEEIVLLFVSNNFSRKGLRTAMEALKKLKGRYRLLVVGSGKVAPFKRLARRLGISHQVLFVGPTSIVEAFYGASDIFVLPTLYDPFANVCLEAMACGLPVITTRLNGASELLTQDAGLVMHDPRDASDLAEKIARLSDEAVRREMGIRAWNIAKDFPMEKNAQRIIEIFEAVLKERD